MVAKRFLDLFIILIILPLWLPLMGLVALIVYMRMGSPVFFVQERPGYQGRPFKLIKFRTMRVGESLPDAQRLSPFGQWLRAISLDELPELWNIIKGEMSLVGPRPLLNKYLPLYSPDQYRRHNVPPGLTGWAQIKGRNLVDWEQRFDLDLWYVDHRTLGLDIMILFKTIRLVFAKEGITGKNSPTMPEFMGNIGAKAKK